MNIGNVLDAIKNIFDRGNNAVNAAQPVVGNLVDQVGPLMETGKELVDIAKDLFQGKDPTPEQIAKVRAVTDDLAGRIAES